jgi:hypothetical protein
MLASPPIPLSPQQHTLLRPPSYYARNSQLATFSTHRKTAPHSPSSKLTPFGSPLPGAGTPRLATFALFQPLPSTVAAGKHDEHGDIRNVVLINTHLDHVSDDQRKLGAAMVLHRARYEALKRPGVTVFVTGDLNRCICLFLSLLFQFSVFLIISATSTRPSMTRCDLVIIMYCVVLSSFLVRRADLTAALMPSSRAPWRRPRSRTSFLGASPLIPILRVLPQKRRKDS